MYFAVISILPQMFCAITKHGIIARAIKHKRIIIDCINPRDFVCDNYRRIDDRPFGGGAGMVMMAEPLLKAIADAKTRAKALNKICPVVYLSPQGVSFDENFVQAHHQSDGMILLCGRYDGIDERVMAAVDFELSLGDYVLTGGELAAMVVMDALSRRVDGVMNNDCSHAQDSFVDGLLDYPQYTKPVHLDRHFLVDAGVPLEHLQDESLLNVPKVLLSGHHKNINAWRCAQKLQRTKQKRPDLYQNFVHEHNATNLDVRDGINRKND